MKKCRLPKKPSQTCSIDTDGNKLSDILKRVDSVTRFSESDDKLTHIHLLVAYESDVFILGRTPDTFVAHHIPGAKADKDAMFNIDPVQLSGLIAKRGEMTLTFDGKMVNIAAKVGKYRSEFKIKPVSVEQIPMVEEGLRHHIKGGHEMSRDVIEKMTRGIRYTRLRDPITEVAVICRVECLGDTLRVTTPGNWTSARYTAQLSEKNEKFRFSLSSGMFDLVSKFCGEDKVNFHVDSASFAAEGDSFVLTLPPIQASDEDYRFIDNMLAQLGNPLLGCVVKGDLSAPFANIATLLDKKTKSLATLIVKKKEFRIKFSNDSGSVQDSLTLAKPVEKEINTRLDMRIMKELLRTIGREDRHSMGFHGPNVNSLKAFSLNYKFEEDKLLYFGYLPA